MADGIKGAKSGAQRLSVGVVVLTLGIALLVLDNCSAAGNDPSAAIFGSACQPFDPDKTHSCAISSERWSEIAETPEPPGMYRYCAWPGLLSGAYRTRYRDIDGTIHDFTEAPAQTPSFLLEALKSANDSPATLVIVYRMVARSHSCPNAPP
jgi:hypothetical protein